jgi:hypothetical protein
MKRRNLFVRFGFARTLSQFVVHLFLDSTDDRKNCEQLFSTSVDFCYFFSYDWPEDMLTKLLFFSLLTFFISLIFVSRNQIFDPKQNVHWRRHVIDGSHV